MLRCKRIQIAGRASVYGFAPMNLDGHLPRWGVEEGEIERLAEGVLDPFIAGITKPWHGERLRPPTCGGSPLTNIKRRSDHGVRCLP